MGGEGLFAERRGGEDHGGSEEEFAQVGGEELVNEFAGGGVEHAEAGGMVMPDKPTMPADAEPVKAVKLIHKGVRAEVCRAGPRLL